MTCSGAVSVMRVKPRRSLNQITASIRSATPRTMRPPSTRCAGVAAEIGLHQRRGHARQRHGLDRQCEVRHDARERCDFAIGKSIRTVVIHVE